jgi:hypothetical protein
MEMDIWRDPDWQAIGTWATGTALAVFAFYSWKLQNIQHTPVMPDFSMTYYLVMKNVLIQQIQCFL